MPDDGHHVEHVNALPSADDCSARIARSENDGDDNRDEVDFVAAAHALACRSHVACAHGARALELVDAVARDVSVDRLGDVSFLRQKADIECAMRLIRRSRSRTRVPLPRCVCAWRAHTSSSYTPRRVT